MFDVTRQRRHTIQRPNNANIAAQGFKIGLCNQPPVGLPYSLLALSNNCCITDTLGALQQRFKKLYKRRWVCGVGFQTRICETSSSC